MPRPSFPKNIPGLPTPTTNPVLLARWAKWADNVALGMVLGNMKGIRQLPNFDPENTHAAKKIQAERNIGASNSAPPTADRAAWLTDANNPHAWTKDQFGSGIRPNPIYIIDIDADPKLGKSYSYITLYTVPTEISFDPSANFSTIASIGRNAPFYHYTGSEDTLSFKLDWFAKDENRKDVIFNCRWLAAMSKSDGYYGDPHRVMVIWGDGGLFANDLWIVTKATYKLSQFQKHQGMLPNQAYQDLELKKVIDTNTNLLDHMGDIIPKH